MLNAMGTVLLIFDITQIPRRRQIWFKGLMMLAHGVAAVANGTLPLAIHAPMHAVVCCALLDLARQRVLRGTANIACEVLWTRQCDTKE